MSPRVSKTPPPVATAESADETNVGTVHAAAKAMAEAALLPRALRAGTKAMRAIREFTPQSPAESDKAYALRLQRSFLFGAYEDVSDNLAAHVFSGGVIVEPPDVATEDAANRKQSDGEGEPEKVELDEEVQAWVNDADQQGTSLEELLIEAFEKGIDVGLVHALVDHPSTVEAQDLEAELASGARPYVTLIAGDDLIQVEHARVNGRERLLRVHRQHQTRVQSGRYGEDFRRTITVYYAGDESAQDAGDASSRWARWERFVADKDDNLPEMPTESGIMRPHVDIPLATWYLRKVAFMAGRPALLRIAEKTAEHWQSASHQRYSLDFARFVQIVRKGFDKSKQSAVGASVIHDLPATPDADMKLLETTGQALSAGRQHLEDCKAEIQTLALEPFMRLTAVTATEVGVQKDQANNKVGGWALGATRFAQQILELCMRWRTPAGAEPKAPGTVSIQPSQKLTMSPQQIEFFKFLAQDQRLTDKTVLRTAKEFGLVPEWLDVAAEVEALKTEAPRLTGLPMPLLRPGLPAVTPPTAPQLPDDPAPGE